MGNLGPNADLFTVFYQVKETWVEVWENSKKLWKLLPVAHVATDFSSSPKLNKCFYNSIETRKTFSIVFRKHQREKGEQLVNFDYQNVNSIACTIIMSTPHAICVSIDF